jgi:hypothetical protein
MMIMYYADFVATQSMIRRKKGVAITKKNSIPVLEMKIWIYWYESNSWIYFYIHIMYTVYLNKNWTNLLVRTKFYWSWGQRTGAHRKDFNSGKHFDRCFSDIHCTLTFIQILYNYCTWTRSIWGFMEQSTTILNKAKPNSILLYSAP